MKTVFAALLSAVLVLCSTLSTAQAPNAGVEIEHLLQYLGSSNCQFNRNSGWYSAAQTKRYLNSKYIDLLDKRSMVLTAEDFIELVAAQSNASGRYLVKCDDGVEDESAAWLSAELARLRKEAK